MPNWNKNIVRISGKESELKAFRMNIASKGDAFDFQKILPMDQRLQVEAGSKGTKGLMYLYLNAKDEEKPFINEVYQSLNCFFLPLEKESFPEFESVTKETLEEYIQVAKAYLENYRLFGHATWYTWRIENWGTKWLAESNPPLLVERKRNTLTYQYCFLTAWAPPLPIFEHLVSLYPSLSFTGLYADIDAMGDPCGMWVGKDGEITYGDIDDELLRIIINFSQDEDEPIN